MLSLRFQRQGKKKDFVFRVIAIDSRFSVKSGKVKEVLGWWNPKTDKFELKEERIKYWLEKGAQPSDSCYNLLVKANIIKGTKKKINIKKKEKEEEKQEGEKESSVSSQVINESENPSNTEQS